MKKDQRNPSDDEEKRLLKILLRSYNDELKTFKQTDHDISTVHTSTTIRFIPSQLNFSEQYVLFN